MNVVAAKLKAGDLFFVPLEDGTFGLGLFHKYSPKALNSCICSFYGNNFSTREEIELIEFNDLRMISLVFVTKDLLQKKVWGRVRNIEESLSRFDLPDIPYENAGSYKGAKVYGAGIIREFLNAYFGILPWNMMHDPTYFDKLLITNIKRPKNLIFQKVD